MFRKKGDAVKFETDLTIHSLDASEPLKSDSKFCVSWKRGKSKVGNTLFVQEGSDGRIVWNERFRFLATLYQGKDGKFYKKPLDLLIEENDKRGHKSVAGSVLVDMGSYAPSGERDSEQVLRLPVKVHKQVVSLVVTIKFKHFKSYLGDEELTNTMTEFSEDPDEMTSPTDYDVPRRVGSYGDSRAQVRVAELTARLERSEEEALELKKEMAVLQTQSKNLSRRLEEQEAETLAAHKESKEKEKELATLKEGQDELRGLAVENQRLRDAALVDGQELKRIRAELQRREDDISALRKEIEGLQEEKQNQQRESDEAIKSLEDQKTALEAVVAKSGKGDSSANLFKAENMRLRTENQELANRLRTAHEASTKLSRDVADAWQELEDARGEMAHFQSLAEARAEENERLLKQIEELHKQLGESEAHVQKVVGQAEAIREAEGKLRETYNKDISSLQEQNAALFAELQEVKRRGSVGSPEPDRVPEVKLDIEKQKQIVKLTKDLEEARALVVKRDEEICALAAKRDEEIRALKKQEKEGKSSGAKSAAGVQMLEEQVKALESRCAQLEMERDDIKRSIAEDLDGMDISTLKKECEAQRAEVELRGQAIVDLRRKISASEVETKAKIDELEAQLKKRDASLDQQMKMLGDMKAELDSYHRKERSNFVIQHAIADMAPHFTAEGLSITSSLVYKALHHWGTFSKPLDKYSAAFVYDILRAFEDVVKENLNDNRYLCYVMSSVLGLLTLLSSEHPSVVGPALLELGPASAQLLSGALDSSAASSVQAPKNFVRQPPAATTTTEQQQKSAEAPSDAPSSPPPPASPEVAADDLKAPGTEVAHGREASASLLRLQAKRTSQAEGEALREFVLGLATVFHETLDIVYQNTRQAIDPVLVQAILGQRQERKPAAPLPKDAKKGGASPQPAPAAFTASVGSSAKSVTGVLTGTLNVMKENNLPHTVLEIFFGRVCRHMDVALYNELCMRDDLCTMGGGLNVKMGVSKIEEWLEKAKLDVVKNDLSHIRDACSLLMVKKSILVDVDARSDVCPSLNMSQIKHFLVLYRPDEIDPEKVPESLLKNIGKMTSARPLGSSSKIVQQQEPLFVAASPMSIGEVSLFTVCEQVDCSQWKNTPIPSPFSERKEFSFMKS